MTLTARITLVSTSVAAVCLAPTALAGGGKTENVEVQDFDFGPKTAKVSQGDKVKWVNKEGAHTVTFGNGFNEVLSDEGESASRRFGKPGTYKYICTFHDDQGMKGKVVVK